MRVPGRISALSRSNRVAVSGLVFVLAICVGCGETYRPVAQPIAGAQPSPGAAHTVIAINTDGIGDNHRGNGTASNINVSGDSIQGNLIAGLAPVHAALTPNGASLYVVNSAQDTVTANRTSSPTAAAATVSLPASPSAAITSVSAGGGTATYTYTGGSGLFSAGDVIYVNGCTTSGFNGAFTVTGASGNTFSASNSTAAVGSDCSSALAKVPNAVFANSTDNNNMWVAGYGTNQVYQISTSTNVVTTSISVGAHPVALAETPDNRHVYVANHGSSAAGGSVSVIDTSTGTVPITICLSGGTPPSCTGSAAPVWAVARSDGGAVFVLDANGTIYVIDTATNSVVATLSAGAGANFMFFDKTFGRLFVTNPAAATLSIFDASTNPPTPHPGNPIAITAAAGSGCSSTPVPQSVTVLADGSRAYVASYQVDNGTVCTQVSVVDAGSGAVTAIPLTQAADTSAQSGCGTAGFRVFAASSGGGTNSKFKVYVSQCDAGSIAVVDTYPANGNPPDTFAGLSLPGPLSTFPPLPTGLPPSQNPVFLVAGP